MILRRGSSCQQDWSSPTWNVYLLVRHVPFIAKGAGFLLQCKNVQEGASSLNFVQRRANVLDILYTAEESCSE